MTNMQKKYAEYEHPAQNIKMKNRKLSSNMSSQSGPYSKGKARFEILFLQYTNHVKYVEYAQPRLLWKAVSCSVAVNMLGRFTAYKFDRVFSGHAVP